LTETKCHKCGKEIYFDKNFKAKNNKFVPLQKDTKKPHRCQNSDNEKLKPKEIPSHIKYLIGCDEAGTGETFGSMFLGCVLVDAENLKNLEQIFDIQNIKYLSEYEILDKYNKIKKYCKIFVKKCEASEIDLVSKNTLLDLKYTELLTEATSGKEKFCVIIDDYGITRELKSFLEKLRSNEDTIICENKADEKYAACQAASVVARKERFDEIRDLNKNFGVQDESGKIVYPGNGSASNPQTAQYLEAFMKKHPSKDFPPFVRRKWSNVQKLLQQKSNQKISQYFEN